MPISLATCATTGAAPVPVPPPMPAVMNSMSQPSTSSTMRSRSSIAACLPTSGSAPAPRPLVILQPICSAVFTLECFKACASVLMHMKSTPSMPVVTMCATALPPPPPTPITLITALWLYASISSNIACSLDPHSGLLQIEKSEIALKPGLHPVNDALSPGASPAIVGRSVVAGVEQEPHAGRIDRAAHRLGKSGHVLRQAQAHRHVEHFLGQFDGALHAGAATGQHDAGRDRLLEAAASQLIAHQAEQLL